MAKITDFLEVCMNTRLNQGASFKEEIGPDDTRSPA